MEAPALAVRLRSYVVIPARLQSTRLPRKMLLNETGQPLIQHTWEACRRATRPLGVRVATDHPEILAAVERFGGQAILTRADAQSGTDRVAEAAEQLPEADVIVNVQGDEPEISAEAIDQVIRLLESHPDIPMATLATPIRDRDALQDPANVKVTFDQAGRALYFSRNPIPCPRQWDDALLRADPPVFYQHLGIYAYRRPFLAQLAALPPSRLERVERLEQLRVLEAGFPIQVGVQAAAHPGIDTWDDYRAFVSRWANC